MKTIAKEILENKDYKTIHELCNKKMIEKEDDFLEEETSYFFSDGSVIQESNGHFKEPEVQS